MSLITKGLGGNPLIMGLGRGAVVQAGLPYWLFPPVTVPIIRREPEIFIPILPATLAAEALLYGRGTVLHTILAEGAVLPVRVGLSVHGLILSPIIGFPVRLATRNRMRAKGFLTVTAGAQLLSRINPQGLGWPFWPHELEELELLGLSDFTYEDEEPLLAIPHLAGTR